VGALGSRTNDVRRGSKPIWSVVGPAKAGPYSFLR
jgi:hypothetical protein